MEKALSHADARSGNLGLLQHEVRYHGGRSDAVFRQTFRQGLDFRRHQQVVVEGRSDLDRIAPGGQLLRPISELMRRLNREGINIARRTVAKYRDELGIPSSTDRKQVF